MGFRKRISVFCIERTSFVSMINRAPNAMSHIRQRERDGVMEPVFILYFF